MKGSRSGSPSLLVVTVVVAIALSSALASPTGPYVEVRIRLPVGVTMGSVSLDLFSGSVSATNDSSFSVNSLSVQMCGTTIQDESVVQLDAISVLQSATLCTRGGLNFTNFFQRGSSVSVSLSSTNNSVITSSPLFGGSYSLTSGTDGVTVSGNAACTTSSSSATAQSGTCGTSSTPTLHVNAAAAAVFEIIPGCPVGFTGDGPMTDIIPASPAVSPATSYGLSLDGASNWEAWIQWGSIKVADPTAVAGVNATILAWVPGVAWLQTVVDLTVQAGISNQFSFALNFANGPSAIQNVSVILIDSTLDPYSWNIDNAGFPPSSPAVLATQVINGPFAGRMALTSVTLTPTRSTALANILIKVVWTQNYGYNWNLVADQIVLTQTVLAPAALTTGASEIVTVEKMPSTFDANPRGIADCPHLATGLSNWHDPSIWPGGVLPDPSTSISIPAGLNVLISSCSLLPNFVYYRIHVPPTSQLIFADANINLRVRNMFVEGNLFIGSPTCRLNANINIEFVGDKVLDDLIGTTYGSKGIGVPGSIDIHGKQYNPTWIRLAATIYPGADTIYLQDSNNWEVGQTIVVATSAFKDLEVDQNEVRVIKAIDSSGTRVQVDSPFLFYHYSGFEHQVEVGLLSRRIVLKGDDSSDASAFGGHIRVTGQGRFSGVQTYRMGQTNVLGKYPFHFHMMGPSPTSFVRDCTIWNSYFRCIAIHATNNTQALRNVVFNATAHCYYLEDGVEENNIINYNLAIKINTIGTPMGGQSQIGEVRTAGPDLILPADGAAAGFYITNAYNTFIGNAASGGWAGFSFPNLPAPIGLSRGTSMVPETRPTFIFQGNTAHSSGYSFPGGGCIYVGGKLQYDTTNVNMLVYDDGRYARATVDSSGKDVWMQFNDTKVWMCGMGISHWGDRIEVVSFESHDSGRGVQVFGEAWFSQGLVNAQSDSLLSFPDRQLGFQFYDTYVKSLVTRVDFRGFVASNPPYDPTSDSNPYNWPDRRAFTSLIHSDYFKPQGISATKLITFSNSNYSQNVGHKMIETGSSRYFNFVDWDGSFGNTGVPQVIGDGREWWHYDAACVFEPDWLCYRCPQGNRTIINIDYTIPGVIDPSIQWAPTSDNYLGATHIFGPGIPAGRNATLTKNAGVTGISQMGWYFHHDLGTPNQFSAWQYVNPQGQWIIGAWKYAAGTTFAINLVHAWGNPTIPVTSVTTMSQLVYGDGTKYFFDGNHLYIKMIDYDNTINYRNFTRDGVAIFDVINAVYYEVTANCAGASGVWCPSSYQHPLQSW